MKSHKIMATKGGNIMKIGVIGATGKSGKLIVKEALKRGHDVTAIVRNPLKVDESNVAVLEKNIFDLKTEDLNTFDVVVNAFNAPEGHEEQHVTAGQVLIDALSGVESTRLIVVGGAGSLYVDEAKTLQLFNTPDFPEAYMATAKNMGVNLDNLEKTRHLNWSMLCPSAFFDPEGEKTGEYQLGQDHLLTNAKGESYISYQDFALAMLDEIENQNYKNKRFTACSK